MSQPSKPDAFTLIPWPERASTQLINLLFAQFVSQSISAVAELGVADHLKDGPQHIEPLALGVKAHPGALLRVLRLLIKSGVFQELEDGRITNNALSECLRADHPETMAPTARAFSGRAMKGCWGDMLHSLRTGEVAFNHVFGTGIFEWMAENPADATTFWRMFDTFSEYTFPYVLASYDFTGVKRFVDIGGGKGRDLTMFLEAYPQARGVLFELPFVIEQARALVGEEALSERIELVSGNFHELVPPGGDVYWMKYVVHNWPDDKVVALYERIRRVMAPGGKIMLGELVIPEFRRPYELPLPKANDPEYIPHYVDTWMLVLTGGRSRSATQHRALFEKAGFRLARIIPSGAAPTLLEAVEA